MGLVVLAVHFPRPGSSILPNETRIIWNVGPLERYVSSALSFFSISLSSMGYSSQDVTEDPVVQHCPAWLCAPIGQKASYVLGQLQYSSLSLTLF